MAIVRIDALRSKGNASITNSYTTLGTALTHNWRMFRLVNTTDGTLLISLDGTTDNLILPPNSFVLYDVSTNAIPLSVQDNLLFQIGTQFYVKYSSAPTLGTVYLEGVFARGE